MKKGTRFVGLDVHADTIAVAVAEAGRDGEVRSLGLVPNSEEGIRRLLKALGGAKGLRACYEAGPTGYALYWRLVRLGVECDVRRVLFEAAWAYRRRPGGSDPARKRRRALELPSEISELAAKAQHRLCRRYAMLVGRGKPPSKAAAAVGRELLGFVWAIATHVEAAAQTPARAAA